jgi:nucleoside-triphosphatase THEP1
MVDTASKIVILSGASGQGKTRVCQALVELVKEHGLSVRGILSPAVFTGGKKIAILAEDACSGEQHALAQVRRESLQGDIQTGHWTFDPEGVAWGNRILAQAGECGLLVVDELGPLEFLQHKGWVEGLQAIERGQYRLAVVVIRPELLEQALPLWPDAQVFTVDPSRGIEEQAWEIFELLLD